MIPLFYERIGGKMSEEKNKKGFLDRIKEINEEKRQAEIEEEKRAEEERIAREKAAKEAYEQRLRQEKIELMRAKQQGDDEPEEPKEEEPKKEYTLKEKIANFFFFYKLQIIAVVGVVALASFLIYDNVTTVKPDCSVMFTIYSSKIENYNVEVEELFNSYTPDVNGDGKNYCEVLWMGIPFEVDGTNYDQAQAAAIQMAARFQTGNTLLIIANSEVADNYGLSSALVDLREKYPDNEHIGELGFYIKGTKFCELIGMPDEEIPEDVFIGIRKIVPNESYTEEMKENYKIAEEILEKLIEDCE